MNIKSLRINYFTFLFSIAIVDDLRLTSDKPTASIISPNYPNKYPKNSYRLWTVQAPVGSVITVKVTAFNLTSTSGNHHLLIGDTSDRFLNIGVAKTTWVRWTGKKPDDDVLGIFHYRSQGPSIYVLFTTSYKSGGTGFSLELRANFGAIPLFYSARFSTIAIFNIRINYIIISCLDKRKC